MKDDYMVSFSYMVKDYEYLVANGEWWKFWKKPEIKRLSTDKWERAAIPVSEEFVSGFDSYDEAAKCVISIYAQAKCISENDASMVCMESGPTPTGYIKSSGTMVDYSENLVKDSDPLNKHNWIK